MAYRDLEREMDRERRKRDKARQDRQDRTRPGRHPFRHDSRGWLIERESLLTGLGRACPWGRGRGRERKAQFTLPCLPCLFKVQGGRIEDQE